MFSRRYYGDILPINIALCLAILVRPKINDIRGNLSHRWGLTFDPNTQVKKCQELYPLPAFHLQGMSQPLQSWHRVLEHRATSAAKSVCWVWCRALSAYGPLVAFGWYPIAGLCFLMPLFCTDLICALPNLLVWFARMNPRKIQRAEL
jgi:hypothetical protein